jgi:Putative prokaryotic signal transducing protein
MKADLDDFRRLYSSLNDEALLAIDRDELVPMAQQCYDAELSTRGLAAAEEEEEDAAATQSAHGELVEIASFENPSEAGAARSLLRSAEIPCMLSTDLPGVGSVLNVAQDVRLFVPADFVAEANEVLDSEISEEELAAQAEAAGAIEEEEIEEEIERHE